MKRKRTKPKPQGKKLQKRSAYDVFKEAGLIGCAKGLPKDLSTNKSYFAGFGRSK